MNAPDLDRRQLLIALAAFACTSGGTKDPTDPTAGDDTDTTTPSDTGSGGWATGGTAAMAAAAYDVTFDPTCAALCELTLGPCYAETFDRQDISEGVDGLGAQMSLQVVDADCAPVAGVVVDVWHCSPGGLYSGDDAAAMCTNGDDEATAGHWFRGTQVTDANGRVDFRTCLPGWYSGRAVHIHLQVRVDGDATATSQLGFPEELLADVYGSHPTYVARGEADTPNDEDNILGSVADTHLFDWRKADDGVLVLSKTLQVNGRSC